MKVGVIIQARMSSTRLPGKIMRPFYHGKSILELIVEAIGKHTNLQVVVATSTSTSDDIFVDFLKKKGVAYYRGSEDDVQSRFIEAARQYSFAGIIRVCSDNPFLDMHSLRDLQEIVETEHSYDYVSFKVNNKPSIKTHFGFWTEYISLEALTRVRGLTSNSIYREHVTNYVYEHEHLFKVKWIEVNNNWAKREDIRLTIDTYADFVIGQEIYSCLDGSIEPEEILRFINAQTALKASMQKEITINHK